MGKIFRLIISIVIFAAVIVISEPLGDIMTPLFGWMAVGLINVICWDFLDVGILDNGFGIFLKRLIYYGCASFAIFASFAVAYQDLVNGEFMMLNQLEKAAVCGSLPATVTTLLICYFVDLKDYERTISPLSMVLGLISGGAVGYIISMIGAGSPLFAFILVVGISGFGLFLLIKLSIKTGFMFDSIGTGSLGSSSSSYHSSTTSTRQTSSYSTPSRSSSSYSSSSSSTYSEGYRQLEYQMSDICYRNSRSRNCSYGVSIRSSISKSLYGDDAVFTVDFEIDTTGLCAQTQNEVNIAMRDIQNFEQEIMNDVYRDAEKLIKRLMDKYPDFYGVNLEVKPGNISQY